MIVFFTGPSGSGKTTLARAWAESRARQTAVIDGDTVTGWTRAGKQSAVRAAATLQDRAEAYRVSAEVCAAMALTYHANGIDVAIAQLRGKNAPPPWGRGWEALDAADPLFVVLYPPLSTCLERTRDRDMSEDEVRTNHAFDWRAWAEDPRAMFLDSTGLTVAETVRAVDALILTTQSSREA